MINLYNYHTNPQSLLNYDKRFNVPVIASQEAAKHKPNRSPALEPGIMKDPKYAYYYAYDIIKGRWKEAEPYIMKDPEYAYYYAHHVIGGRWPEAEPYIMKDPFDAYIYAKWVIKDRWPEAEHTIQTNKQDWINYKHTFNITED